MLIVLSLGISFTIVAQTPAAKIKPGLVRNIKATPGLVALWDFKEKEGHARKAYGMDNNGSDFILFCLFPTIHFDGRL